MTDLLIELRSEEIPARMQDRARDEFARLFAAEIAKAGLAAPDIVTYAGPRRLALIARGLPEATEGAREEVKGPRVGAPPQALDGFLRKTGLTEDALIERDGVWFAITERPGRATAGVIAEAIPAIVRGFAWPKSMRWGEASASADALRWVRPLHGIVALFGDAIVDCAIGGIASGRVTAGHRVHHPEPVSIVSAEDYVEALRAAHVLVDQDERRAIVRDRAAALAAEAGLALVDDEGLVAENAGLTEWPVPLLGRFDADFLSVPPEVIQLTARVNQKYFVCRDADGALANAFVCTANLDACDGGAKIVAGNAKVLAARLADARFFYDTDLKAPLEAQAAKLDRIVFHEKLGTVADKVERVAKLARWLVEEGIVKDTSPERGGGPAQPVEGDAPSATGGLPLHHQPAAGGPPPRSGEVLADLAERAARLAKADLVTGMVGEFPELQGVMGGYYAAAQGEDLRVAAAVRDHYKPVGQGDDVPTEPVTVAVALADKLDTLIEFFEVGMAPTGSKDPFALRRAAISSLAIAQSNELRLPLLKTISERFGIEHSLLIAASKKEHGSPLDGDFLPSTAEVVERAWRNVRLLDFFADRLKVQQREAGVRHDLIDAVFALGGEDDLVRLLARVRALQAFVGTPDGANLLAGYKRAANILRKEGFVVEKADTAALDASSLSCTLENAEAALIAALDVAAPAASAAVAAEDFAAAMGALATLRAPIDAFFEHVTVNAPDPAVRARRLALLARVRDAVHTVADFSRIEG